MSVVISCAKNEDFLEPETALYFPPLTGNSWEITSISDLGWNQNEVQPLLNYLEETNTKSFIMLYNGRIVIEHYFNGQTASMSWYWASAGKTLTSIMIDIAEEKELLNSNNKVSNYLGAGWTNAPLDKENLITCKTSIVYDFWFK